MSESFCKLFVDSFESRSDRVAMRLVGSDEEVYTFGEMLRRIRSVAYRLGQEGVEFGDRVALIGENHPSWAIAYLGTLYHGAVCVPLDPHGEIDTIANFLENSKAKLAFLSPDQVDRFSKISEKLERGIPAVVWTVAEAPASAGGVSPAGIDDQNDEEDATSTATVDEPARPPASAGSFDDWAATDFPESFAKELPKAAGSDMALLMYTSGTTGTPKGVPLTHGNIVGEISGVNAVLTLGDQDRILSLLPLFHAYLQVINMWVASTFGAEVGYLKELTPAELSESMKSFKPTILSTVPRLWYLFHKKIFDAVAAKPKTVQALFRTMLRINGVSRDTFGVNLGAKLFSTVHESFGGNLRIAISAGSRFDEKVAEDFHRLGFTIIQGYGLTETSGAATATYESDNRVGSVGKPMGDAEIKIAEPDKDGVGEVLIRGSVVFDGYYQNPDATAEAFTEDGWFRSGDLGRIDEDGFLFIVGRGKDVIVLPSGKNVHPEDLEVQYLKCPLVEELAIVGVEDQGEGRAGAEKLIAVVVPDFAYLKTEKIANSKEAIRHELDTLGRSLPEYQRVRDYIIRAEPLPRTATNKVKRFQLKKEIETGEIGGDGKLEKTWTLSDEETSLMNTGVAQTVVAAIKQNTTDIDVIHPAMNLEIDLGLDSLGRAETFAALEQAFDTEFNGDDAAQALTVTNVIDLVKATPKGAELDASGGGAENLSLDLNWSKIVREAEPDFPEIRDVLRTRPLFSVFAFCFYKVFNLIFRIFLRLEVEGIENLDKLSKLEENGRIAKPFLICPNHQSFLDPFVLSSNYNYALFKNIFHVGASEFFEGSVTRAIARMLNVVPVNPDTELMRAMKAGAAGAKNGKILNIYPEGERAFDGELHEFKKGAAILATELDIPIVPVAIDGLHKVWARNSSRIRLGKVKIRIGEPFYARDVTVDDNPGDGYERVTDHLKQQIAAMVSEMRA
ncbi:MAG: AMP-binding protein [Pyrinomonadaceae bacterium]